MAQVYMAKVTVREKDRGITTEINEANVPFHV